MLVKQLNILFFSFFILPSPFLFLCKPTPFNLTLINLTVYFLLKPINLKKKKKSLRHQLCKTDVHVDVQGLLSTTTVKQYFINPTNTWMEATYLFPLPEKSAVDFLRMKIGDRFIEGEIQEKVEAEKIYQKAKKKWAKSLPCA